MRTSVITKGGAPWVQRGHCLPWHHPGHWIPTQNKRHAKMKFPATTFNIFYFELNMSWMGWHKFWLTLCPLMPGRPGVPGKPRAPWEKQKQKNKEVTKVIISALFLFYISVVRISNLPEGQKVHAHRGDLVCQTHPERKRVGEMGTKWCLKTFLSLFFNIISTYIYI